MVGRKRTTAPKPPETDLQELFLERVREEMGEMSIRELSMRPGAPNRRTLTDVLNAGAVPRLTFVHQIATALGVHAWELMMQKPASNQEILTNVRKLPPRYKPIFPARREIRTESKAPARNKTRA